VKTQSIVKGALFIGLFFITSNIIPPILVLGVPFTLQTLLILIIPFFFSLKDLVFWYFGLLLITLIGIPIMSNFSGGPQVLIGPSAGFIYGWLPKLILIKMALDKKSNLILFLLITSLSSIINLVIGGVWLTLFTELSVLQSIQTTLVSFLHFELVKGIIAFFIIKKLPNHLLITRKS